MGDEVSNEVLEELLNEALHFDATTSGGLTNHLPMALVAKSGLGAGPEELSRFAGRYHRRLAPLVAPRERLSATTWRRVVGVHEAYPDLVDYFTREVSEHGVEVTLRAHLVDLVDGISGAAFHGVIRLAYALDVEDPDRISTGLAYVASSSMTLGPLEVKAPKSDDPAALLVELAKVQEWQDVTAGRSISGRMRVVASDDAFRDVAPSLVIGDDTARTLSDLALALYASTDDFTALHGVTGLEALAKLRPYVEDTERFDRATFQALGAAYLSIGAPPLWSRQRLDDMIVEEDVEASAVRRHAALSNDEHVSKIVFTSTRRYEATSDPLYLAVAARAVRLDESITEPVDEETARC